MFELCGSQHIQQYSPMEFSAFPNCTIAPVEYGQPKSLPPFINPCRVSVNPGVCGFGFTSLLMEKSLPHIQTVLAQNQGLGEQISKFPSKLGEEHSQCEPPSQEKKFLIFDHSGNETRVISCSQLKGRIGEQAWTRTPALFEASNENEIFDEVSEMREDSDDIDALLYSDGYDGDDNRVHHSLNDDDDDGDDDEVSSGHSPFSKERHHEKQEDEEILDNVVTSKRQKTLPGGCKRLYLHPPFENVNDGDLIGAFKEIECPIVGNKRQKKDKIHDTLRVLESILPGLKSKDPLVILDEAIRYLKCLKYNAEAMSSEDLKSSS